MRLPDPKPSNIRVDKVFLDAVSREMESVVIPMADDLAVRTDRLVADKLSQLTVNLAAARSREARDIEDRMRVLEAKLATLESIPASPAPIQATSSNPYADIEHLAKGRNWDAAWRRAVEVYNGIDFMVHLMAGASAEDFFSENPVLDPLLSLQICINACQEMSQSDKSVSEKLDIVSELILGLTNPSRINLSHQFLRLKQLVDGLVATSQSSRVREIQKIILATERLLTPPISVAGTPAPPVRYPAVSPSPMYP